jgi:hypothetical protein
LHTRRPLHAKVPPPAWPACTAVGADRRDAPPWAEGHRRPPALLTHYPAPCPAACRCLADEAAARLPQLKGPARHRQYGRTVPLVARAGAEERRRPNVLPPLWAEASGVTWGALGACAGGSAGGTSSVVRANSTTFAPDARP